MPAKRPQCTKVAFSYWKETAYGTAVLDANIIHAFEPTEPILPEVTVTRVTDAELIKGHEWPVSFDQIVSQDVSLPFTFPLSFELFGFLSAMSMGGLLSSGTSPNFIHTIKPQVACTSDQLPSSSMIFGMLGATESYHKLKGVVVNELSLSIDSRAWINMSGNLQTDGTLTDAAAFDLPAVTFPAKTYGVGYQSKFSIGAAAGSLVDQSAIFLGADFSITNNLDIDGARQIVSSDDKKLTELRFQDRAYRMTVRLQGHIGDALWNLFENNTQRYVRLEVIATAQRSLQIDFPKASIESATTRFDGIRDVIELTIVPWFDTSESTPVIIEVKNSVEKYLNIA